MGDVPSRRDAAVEAAVMTVCAWLRCPNDDVRGAGPQPVAIVVDDDDAGGYNRSST